MFDHLDIYTPAERLAVGLADTALAAAAWPARRLSRRRPRGAPRRVLLLRLERIGDLLMTLGAIRAVRAQAPDAEIDLVVGSWNVPLASLIAEATRVETLDVSWLARGAGATAAAALVARATSWRDRKYDLAINFEGDIRSHGLLALSGATRRVGHGHAGGGPLLTDVVTHDSGRHVAQNAIALVERAFDLPPGTLPDPLNATAAPFWRLQVPEDARRAARAMLAQLSAAVEGPWLAVHAPGGRLVKQWPAERFAESAAILARDLGATIVLTGAPSDESIVNDVELRIAATGVPTARAVATDLVLLAAVLQHSTLLLTGDTGPMHLAAAVGTPVVAVFGPSMPWRYAPLVEAHRIVRVDLPCSPCNRIRVPPVRCQGHSPDCLTAISVADVVAAGRSLAASRGIAMESS
jgi:lipopolysaccharide heptosyltransferase II